MGEKYCGLPLASKERKPISLSGDMRTGINHYLLENFNSLATVPLVPAAVEEALLLAVSV